MSLNTSLSWKETAWNGLRFQCPKTWDVIVSGDHHLLFEENFTPVLELRWHTSSDTNTSSVKTILDNLQKSNSLIPAETLPTAWHNLSHEYNIYLLHEKTETKPRAALLNCQTCGTSLLFYFFETLPPTHTVITTLLISLCCHREDSEKTVWAIQDFRFSLKEHYHLDTYNFGAGLTRISFTHGSLILHICRLAPASQRLQSASLTQLLMVLGDVELNEQEMIQTERMVSHSKHPSIFKQILDRFKRKLPFHEMILRHHHQCDRLTGLFIFDKKPIPETIAKEILESYEIFPA